MNMLLTPSVVECVVREKDKRKCVSVCQRHVKERMRIWINRVPKVELEKNRGLLKHRKENIHSTKETNGELKKR